MRDRKLSALKRVVAANVRRLRLENDLTQEMAAERAGLETRHWQKIEAAEMNITLSTLAKLCNALGCDAPALLQRPAPGR